MRSIDKNKNINKNKNECIDECKDDYLCHLCDTYFKHKSMLNRHLQRKTTCVDLIVLNEKIKLLKHNEPISNIYINNIQNQNNQNIQNTTQNIQNTQNIQSNTFNNTQQQLTINQINVNPFGQENMDYFLKEESLEACLSLDKFEQYIKDIHMNEKHPENHNIYLKSSKKKEYYILTENGRKIENEKDISEKVLINNIERLKSYKDECIENFDTTERSQITSFINQAELDKSVIRRIKNILINSQEFLKLQPEWSKKSLAQ